MFRRALGVLIGAAGLGCMAVSAFADDWTQFRGPQRTGVTKERGWAARWPESGPKKLWSLEVGEGYATPLISKGRAYVLGSDAQKDTVYCLNAETGKEVWKVAFPHKKRAYPPDNHSNGLTATPLLHNERLYVLFREGMLMCLDAKSGGTLWQTDLIPATGAKLPYFGVSSSPILEGERLIFNLGLSGAAVEAKTGKVAWKSAGMGGYASPVATTRNGKREIAFYGENVLVGVEAATGKELWKHPWKAPNMSAPSADPVFYGDSLFASAGPKNCKLLKLEGAAPTVVWQSDTLCADFTNPVLVGDSLYGNCRNKLTCVDIKTGETRWQEAGMGQGSLIAADGKLIVLTERGHLLVAEANPEKYVEIAKTKVFDGKTDFFGSAGWVAPTLANGRLYCRTASGTLVCLDLRTP